MLKISTPVCVWVAAEYGALLPTDNPLGPILPEATQLCLGAIPSDAMYVACAYDVSLGQGERIKVSKLRIFSNILISRFMTECTNSVTEAKNICELLKEAGVHPWKIIFICDKWHARRAKLIWKHYFPGAVIEIRTVKARWDENHASWLQRSKPRWIFTNIVGEILTRYHLLRYGDLDRMAHLTQVGRR